jgi:hypothetical protein
MTQRRGGGRGTGRPKEPTTYYSDAKSDRSYAARARERVARRTRQQWIRRFVILIVLALAVWLLGPTVMNYLQGQGEEVAGQAKGVATHIRSGVDERSGADFDDSEP